VNHSAHLTEKTEQPVVPVLKGETILIGPSSFAALDREPMDILKGAGATVIDNPSKRRLTKQELIDLLKDGVTGLIAGLEPLDREVMERSKIRVISRCGSGMSNVDQQAAKELNITVCSTPDAPVLSVVELTFAALLSLLRFLPPMDRDLHNGQWHKRIGHLLYGRTVVIIGYGRIGQKVASLLDAFGAKWIVVDPFLRDGMSDKILTLEEALPQADIITIHSNSDQNILGKKEFSLIKPGTLLLNGARGELVDEQCLIKALDDGRIAGAWLDVFVDEPYKGALLQYEQVILTPHVGSYTKECRLQMETEAVTNLIEAFVNRK